MAKNFVLWAVIAAVLMMVFNNFQNVRQGNQYSYSEFIDAVESGQIEKVTISGQSITGMTTSSEPFETVLPAYDDKLIPF